MGSTLLLSLKQRAGGHIDDMDAWCLRPLAFLDGAPASRFSQYPENDNQVRDADRAVTRLRAALAG